jgi:hypothetical protein
MFKIFLLLIFGTFASGIQISCRYGLFNYADTHIVQVPTCYVLSMDFSDNATHLTAANGTIEQIESVKFIYFGWVFDIPCAQFKLDYVPQGILNVFPRVEGIYLRNCPITRLNGNELDEHVNLTSFFISGSQLANGRVPANLFTNTPNL